MTPEAADQLLAFLAELTDEDGGEEARAQGMSRLLGLLGLGYRAGSGDRRRRRGAEGTAGREVLVRGRGGGRQPARHGESGPAGGGRRAFRCVPGPSAAAIGAQLGRPPVMAVGVRDRALAGGMVPPAPARS